MEDQYSVYSEFDIEKHKAHFVDYLEVVIDESGKIQYAVPSHQMKAVQLACDKLNVTRRELDNMCPPEYYGDYAKWLCMISGAVMVWNRVVVFSELNTKQLASLRKLKMAGLFKGKIPEIS